MYKDIDTKRKYDREYYHKQNSSYKKRKQELQIKRRRKIKSIIHRYKRIKGCLCGERDPICLEFHHLENKDIEIANAIKNAWSLKRIKGEIKKCEVLCSNCHKKLHFYKK